MLLAAASRILCEQDKLSFHGTGHQCGFAASCKVNVLCCDAQHSVNLFIS